ncbi:hypothetical protein [Corynebacterium sp. 401_CJEI]|uniref:hypothetical protein n=1 Tax=Corynebacterium sp. 401_CJEI TaxID=2715676 RepID=UPI000667F7ED|nr:hypothetical protein [Corynebacterium sp. 401_CJEI]
MNQEGNSPDLPELVAAYADATAADNSLATRQLESVFAHHFYNPQLFSAPEAHGVTEHVGAFYRIVREVTESLGMMTAAHDAALNWMVWASDNDNVPEYWRARARLAADEARRYTTFIADGPTSAAAETEIPLIARMSREITSYRALVLADNLDAPTSSHSAVTTDADGLRPQESSASEEADEPFSPRQWKKRAALTDALIRIASALRKVNREDLAQELHEMIRALPNEDKFESIALAKTLTEASLLHRAGKVVDAARLCASQLNAIGNRSVIAGLELRQNLARYSIETGNSDTAFRMLSNNVAVADQHRLDTDYILAVREMADINFEVAHNKPDAEEMLKLTQRAQDVSEDYPDCEVTMEIALLKATALYELGDFRHAGQEAESVAKWSEPTQDSARTDFSCAIAAESAVQEGNTEHAAVLFDALADIRAGYSSPISPAETLMNAALSLSNVGATSELTDHLMERSRGYVVGSWESAKWHEAQALLCWSVWDNDGVYKYSDEAAELFLEAHAPADAARTLTIAVRAAASDNNEERARRFAIRIGDLVGPDHPVRDEVRELMRSFSNPD